MPSFSLALFICRLLLHDIRIAQLIPLLNKFFKKGVKLLLRWCHKKRRKRLAPELCNLVLLRCLLGAGVKYHIILTVVYDIFSSPFLQLCCCRRWFLFPLKLHHIVLQHPVGIVRPVFPVVSCAVRVQKLLDVIAEYRLSVLYIVSHTLDAQIGEKLPR